MGLKPELVEALRRINFITATDVQEQSIPVALQGRDMIVRAKTGTGKTCSFLVPILQNEVRSRDPEALIIVPTRELALQIYGVATKLRANRRDSVAVVYGGASINVQMQSLARNPSMVIGTPGRIIDLLERRALRLSNVRFLVLDEADTMLDMGFIEDVELIMSRTPDSRQTMLFSATIPDRIVDIARHHMRNPEHVSVGSEEEPIVTQINHYYAMCEYSQKFAVLLAYLQKYPPKKAIIFVQTQYAASAIYEALTEQGIRAMLMHGGMTQAKRERSLNEFKERGRLLIATNVAARGIDISGISDIINFDAPEDPNVYVHRVGRSARMNADGRAFTIIGTTERNLVRNIEFANNIRMELIELDISRFAHVRVFRKRGRFDRHGGQDRHGGGGWRSGQQGHGGFHRDRRDRGDRGDGRHSRSPQGYTRGKFGRH